MATVRTPETARTAAATASSIRNRTDPGPNWPWSHYIDRVRAHCNDGGGSPVSGAIIVDSNNANNNPSVAKLELTGTWAATAATSGYYGSGYWFANTAGTSAPATFWFYLPSGGTRTIDGWWTAGGNRASAAPFIAAGSEVGRRLVNQRTSGRKWFRSARGISARAGTRSCCRAGPRPETS